jgi:hypothetical protein
VQKKACAQREKEWFKVGGWLSRGLACAICYSVQVDLGAVGRRRETVNACAAVKCGAV